MRLPEHFLEDDLVQYTVGVGPRGDGVMFHAHTAAWNALVFGSKSRATACAGAGSSGLMRRHGSKCAWHPEESVSTVRSPECSDLHVRNLI